LQIHKPDAYGSPFSIQRISSTSLNLQTAEKSRFGKLPGASGQRVEFTAIPVFRVLRSRFWHIGGTCPNCDTFAERLTSRFTGSMLRSTETVLGKPFALEA
jgi:hypothetical protein